MILAIVIATVVADRVFRTFSLHEIPRSGSLNPSLPISRQVPVGFRQPQEIGAEIAGEWRLWPTRRGGRKRNSPGDRRGGLHRTVCPPGKLASPGPGATAVGVPAREAVRRRYSSPGSSGFTSARPSRRKSPHWSCVSVWRPSRPRAGQQLPSLATFARRGRRRTIVQQGGVSFNDLGSAAISAASLA